MKRLIVAFGLIFLCTFLLLVGWICPLSAEPKRELLQEDIGVINAMRYAVNATALNDTTLNAAISAVTSAGSPQRIILLQTGTWTFSNTVTVPANITLWLPTGVLVNVNAGVSVTVTGGLLFDRGSQLCPNASASVAINGQIDAPVSQIFCVAGATGMTFVANNKLAEIFPQWWGATGDGVTDDTAALQAALNAATAVTIGGMAVTLPRGYYRTTDTLVLPSYIIVRGVGRLSSVIVPEHTLVTLLSTATINIGPTGRYLELRDFGIVRAPGGPYASTGSGYVDISGAFITIRNMYFSGSLYNIVLNQSELVNIYGSEIITGDGCRGLWLTGDGAFYPGTLPGFTNVISVTDTQFNAYPGAILLLDDGGANHNFTNNNFNSGSYGIISSNNSGFRLEGNFFESQTVMPLLINYGTFDLGTIHYANYEPAIKANGFSTTQGALYHIQIFNLVSGSITDNAFVGSTGNSAAIAISDDGVSGVLIEGNAIAPPSSLDIPMIDTTITRLGVQRYRQRLMTSHQAPVSAGGNIVLTPRNMGFPGSAERLLPGQSVVLRDLDLVTREITTVTAVTNTTFTVNLANSYAANFLIFGGGQSQITVPYGSGVNAGVSAVAAGDTFVIITHNLGYAPHASDILIVPTADIALPIYNIAVTNITTAQFSVQLTSNPGGAGFQFGWRILPPAYGLYQQ